MNEDLQCEEIILPGILADTIDDDWLHTQEIVLEEISKLNPSLHKLMTVALGADAVRDAEQISLLIERSLDWDVFGYYVVCEHPNGNYLVNDPSWLANLLDLLGGFKINGAKVVVGYCNHQILIAGTVKADAICSGTWLNVRSFPPSKFYDPGENEIKRRATWYYCPQALSEYRIPYLDLAHQQNVLSSMAPPPELDGGYADALFSGVQPSSAEFPMPSAFRHYLHCLRQQVEVAVGDTFNDSLDRHEQLLQSAEDVLTMLRARGISGEQREFYDCIQTNRSALTVLKNLRGPMLNRNWMEL